MTKEEIAEGIRVGIVDALTELEEQGIVVCNNIGLYDRYAAAALQGLLAYGGHENPKVLAEQAHAYAQAMCDEHDK
jgi:hypothetical protein